MSDTILDSIAAHVRDNTSLEVAGEDRVRWSLEGLDSVEMLELIEHLESTFGITVDERDIRPENFGSVGAAARYVASKRGERQGA